MRAIWQIFKRDCGRIRTNVIAMVVATGLVVIPSLYAWFNIAAEWDPYSSTGGVRVAVASVDAGYKSDLLPVKLNVGDQVVSALRANDQLNWVFTDKDEAIDGVRAGRYYAALVIPEDFSADMMTVLSNNVEHASIEYYSNQKESAIAPKVTDKGADTVRATVNQVFTQTVTEAAGGIASDLAGFLNGDQISTFASRLDGTVTQASQDLRTAASHVSAYASLADSASSLLASTSGLLGDSAGSASGLGDALAEARGGVSGLKDALGGATASVGSSLGSVSGNFDDVTAAVDAAFATGTTSVGDASATLRGQADKARGMATSLESGAITVEKIRDGLGATVLPGVDTSLSALATQLRGAATTQQALADALAGAAGSLDNATSTAEADRQALHDLINQSKAQLAGVESTYEDTLRSQASALADSVGSVSASASEVSGTLSSTVSDLQATSNGAAEGLGTLRTSLDAASATLTEMADGLDKTHANISDALASGDLERVRRIIGNDPEGLAAGLASPVGLDRKAIYPVENTGSSMAPYFTTLAIWVGCVILSAMMRVEVPARALAGLGMLRPHQVYVGRLLTFLMFSLLQATLVCLGDLLYLQIQCVHPWLFLLAGWLASFVFLNIVYALVASFGDVGKAIGVVFMVMQVAGSGGIFPVEVMPGFFKAVYEFLPFVHSMGMMKFAIAGGLPGEFALSAVKLLAFLVPALLLGLLLRKPVMRLNRWFMGQLESTKVM